MITITWLSGLNKGSVTFQESRVTLGTAADCQVKFDPTWDRTVSALHATLEVNGSKVTISDSSKDGVFRGGLKLSGPTELRSGDELSLGRGGPRLRVEWGAGAAPAHASVTSTFSRAVPPAAAAPRPALTPSGGRSAPPVVAAPIPPPVAPSPRPPSAPVARPWGMIAVVAALVVLIGGGVGYWLLRSGAKSSGVQVALWQDLGTAKEVLKKQKAEERLKKATYVMLEISGPGATSAKREEALREFWQSHQFIGTLEWVQVQLVPAGGKARAVGGKAPTWLQVTLSWSEAMPLLKHCRVRNGPALLLLDREGKVLASALPSGLPNDYREVLARYAGLEAASIPTNLPPK